MTIDCHALKTLQSLAPWIAICVSVFVFGCQLRRSRFSQSVDLLLKFEQRFFEDLVEARISAAKAFKNNRSSPSSEIEDVLDFFETVGLLVRRKALDKEMVWHTFYHWLHRYYVLSESYIGEQQKGRPEVWKDLDTLDRKMVAIERKTSKSKSDDIRLSEAKLQEFIEDECNLEHEN